MRACSIAVLGTAAVASLAIAESQIARIAARPASGGIGWLFAGPLRHKPVFDALAGTGEDEMKSAARDLKKATDQVKAFAEKTTVEIKNLGKVTDETKEAADKALVEMNTLSTRIGELEKKIVRRPGGGALDEVKSIGQLVVEDEDVKEQIESGRTFKGTLRVEVKSITSASTTGASSSTGLVVADRQPGVITIPNRPLMIRDLLMPGRTASASIDYVQETLVTNAAAAVAENPAAPKPESNIAFALKTTPVRTIATHIMASQQIMMDAPMLQSYIDGRLRYMLAYAEELQLLLGDGTGVNLLGLMPQATAYVKPAGVTVSSETYIDRLRLAMLQATLALFPATGHVLNPTDWATIELTKDTQGRYIFANPTGLVGPTLWGLPVAVSLAMPQNNFLTGAFRMAAQIFDRMDASVQMSTEDRDNFVRNMVTILAELRMALCVYRQQALIKGLFTP